MAKDNVLSAFTLVQQLKDEYWKWAAEPPAPPIGASAEAFEAYGRALDLHERMVEALAAARDGEVSLLVAWVAERLAPCGVQSAYGIIHDKDEKHGEAVAVHVHIVVRFIYTKEYKSSRTAANVAEALGVPVKAVKRPPKGRNSIDNILAYLIHAKDADKAAYAYTDVASYIPNGSEDESYADIYRRRCDAWNDGRGIKTAKRAEIKSDTIVSEIMEGRLTEEDLLLDPALREVYARHCKKIDDALKVYGKYRSMINKKRLENGEFKKVVIFLEGKSGAGKSHLAMQIAMALVQEEPGEKLRIFKLAAKNPVDKYIGEEILVGNDLEPSSFSVADWKRIMDPAEVETVSARYKDAGVAARFIILSAAVDISKFFYDVAPTNEEFDQFIRRISVVIKVEEPDIKNPENTKFRVGGRKVVKKYKVTVPGVVFPKKQFTANYAFDFLGDDTFLCDEAVARAIELAKLYGLPPFEGIQALPAPAEVRELPPGAPEEQAEPVE